MSNFPYPGLRSFQNDEADIFFGREEHTDQLLSRLQDTHFLAIIGSSGCGKSSLVKAGLLAGLEAGFLPREGVEWCVTEFRPGNHPFAGLSEALLANTSLKQVYSSGILENYLTQGPLGIAKALENASSQMKNTNLLLLVDQFEELFRYIQEGKKDEIMAFINLLLNSSKHQAVYVVITIRSEFLGDCQQFHGLPQAINEGMFFVPRLTREQLEVAIRAPARVFCGQLDPALITVLLNDISNDPDQLPLSQHVLMRMWRLEQAKNRGNSNQISLTLADYENIGRISAALSAHADEAYHELDSKQRQIAKILFCRLTWHDRHISSKPDVRRLVGLEEVAAVAGVSWEEVAAVADVFRKDGRRFLMPAPQIQLKQNSILDISHESLIRQWKRLRKWAEQETKSANIYRRLQDHALRWEAKEAEIWRGSELEKILEWREETKPTPQWAHRYGMHFELAMRFLDASVYVSEREAEREAERKRAAEEHLREQQLQQQHAQLRQERKRVILALTVLVAVTVLAVGVNWTQNKLIEAKEKTIEIETEARQKVARALERQTLSLTDSKLLQTMLLGSQENYETARKNLAAFQMQDSQMRPLQRHTRNLLAWFSTVMGASPRQKYEYAGAPLLAVAVTPNGQMAAAGGENGTLILYDAPAGKIRKRLQGHTDHVYAVAFHPQNKWLASAGDDGRIILWALPAAERQSTWLAHARIKALAISPDGAYLASGGEEGDIVLWDTETGKAIHSNFTGYKGSVADGGISFSPDGELLAGVFHDETAYVWEVSTGKVVHKLQGAADSLCFSPDGKLLATSNYKKISLWNMGSEKLIREFHGHKNTVYGLRFVVNGDYLYLISASDDRTLRLWDTDSGITVRVLEGHSGGVFSISTATETGQVLSTGNDGKVLRWDLALPYQQAVKLPGSPASTAIAPDGNTVAVGFAEGALRLYSFAKPAILLWEDNNAHRRSHIQDLAFSPNGALLASASLDDMAKVWRVEDNKLFEQQIIEHQDDVDAVAFSPDAQTLATAGLDGRIGLFAISSGRGNFYEAHEGNPVHSLSFAGDNNLLLSTGKDDIRLWNLNKYPPELVQQYPKVQDELMWSAISPDGRQVVGAGRGRLIHVYSTQENRKLYDIPGHQSTIYRIIFSPDSHQIITAGVDGTLQLWRLKDDMGDSARLFSLNLPTPGNDPDIPLWDFDFRCDPQQTCRIAVPLTRGKLVLYELGKIYD